MNEPRTQFGSASTTRTQGLAIDEGLRKYMLGVYNYMALGVAATGLFSMLVASNPALINLIMGTPLKWVGFAGILGLGWFAPRVIFSGSKVAAHAMFWVYAALWGLMIAPWLYAFAQADAAQVVYRAFFLTAAIFGGMSLWGYTTKRNLSGWSTALMMIGVGLLGAIVINAIFGGTFMSLVISSAVVVFISAVTAYETQMVKSMYVEGGTNDRAAIFGAFALYGSFVTLFIHILNILGIMRE